MNHIPKHIFQTHKSDTYIASKPKLASATNTWKQYNDEFVYYFYDDDMCDKFMKEHFDEKTNKAYSMLPMAVMKADLWRYCIIYKYGGIYADTDTVCNIHPNLFINNSYLTISPENGANFFCQWTFAAPPNSPILKSIIDLSVERILTTQIKGEHIIHYLTGPALFTDGVIKYIKENDLPTFDHVTKYCDYPLELLVVIDNIKFHSIYIRHLYAGDDEDGWKKERFSKLCD
jgi:mannosyltransferase OCH1-like enzyme